MDQIPPSFNSLEDFPPLGRSYKKSVEKGRCPVCKWSVCQCQTFIESFSFFQASQIDDSPEYLKGGARPKKVKVPKLRIVESVPQYEAITNHLRGFSEYWHHYDNHQVCGFEKKCAFCTCRSISMRISGLKREPSIKPRELESVDLESLNVVFPAMAEACPQFKNDSILKVYCGKCDYMVPVGQSPILQSVYNHGAATVEESVNFLVRRKLKFTPNCCQSVCENFILEKQRFILVAFEQPISNIGSTTFKIQNVEFQILSILYEGNGFSSDEEKVAFRHEEVFLSQSKKEIHLENLSIDSGKVSLVILGRTGQKGASKMKPYDKTAMYEKSADAKKRKVEYEKSVKGKETRLIYEVSDEGKYRKMVYEASADGNETRVIYEAAEEGK